MDLDRKERMRARMGPVTEYGIGLFLLTEGWEMAGHFDRFPVRVVFIFLAGAGNRERAQKRFQTVQAVAFIVFAVATSAFNALTDRKVEVYAVGGLLILAGVLILKKMRARKAPS